MRHTKIVCTLGPATSGRARLLELGQAGMDVARLNFSHGDHESHAERFHTLRDVEAELGRPISVIQDLSGPKLRIGELPPDGIPLGNHSRCRLVGGDYEPGPEPGIPVPIPALLAALRPGHNVFLDDGQIQMTVLDSGASGVRCEVSHGGVLTSRKGITAPTVPFLIPALTDKDLTDLEFGLRLGVDWVAVSFVRRPEDLAPVHTVADRVGRDVRVIPKIEKPEALDRLLEILDASDGLMVARGDLGVEIPLVQVPLVQKRIIRMCNDQGKPVITATQMLESMTHSPRPTRAEVSDVANAVLDGTSALMLSGETAVGEYPVEAVRTMAAIAEHTEEQIDFGAVLRETVHHRASTITDAITQGVAQIAHDLQVAAILCSTTSGHTARMMSRMRPPMPILAATSNPETYRRLPLIRGVRPLMVPHTTSTDRMLEQTVRTAREAGWVHEGDVVVITLGAPIGTPGSTNLIKVQKL